MANNTNDLMEKLVSTGFEVEVIQYMDSLGFLASLVYKWFGNPNGDLDPKSVRMYDRYVFRASAILDRLFRFPLGKNIWAVARKPGNSSDANL